MTYRRSAVERAESARQRLVLVGQGATSFHLVAELRLLLPLMFGLLVIVLGWALTTFCATDDGTMMPSNSSSMHFQVDPADMTTSTTMFNAMLASTTTDSELDSSYNSLGLLDQKSTDGDVLDKVVMIPSDTTTFSAILASSTDGVSSSMVKPTDEQLLTVIQQALGRSKQSAEDSLQKFDQIKAALNQELNPTELVRRLRDMDLLTDVDDGEMDITSLFEPNARATKGDERRHDPWWYETAEDGVLDLGTTSTSVEDLGHDNNAGAPANRSLSRLDVIYSGFAYNGSYSSTNSSFVGNRTLFSGLREMLWADPRKLTSMKKSVHGQDGSLKTVHWALKHRLHLVMVVLGSILICASITMMQHQRQGHGFRGPPQYQADVGTATLKTPPAWCQEQSGSYSLRSWISDVIMWSQATDLEPERQAAAVALQVTGIARDLVREIPSQHLRDGVIENGQHLPGLMILCRTLANHFAPLEAELQTRSMGELMQFSRMNSESIDSCLTRFGVLRHRAAQRGGMHLNFPSLSYVLLNGLKLRTDQWDRALIATDGAMPVDEIQFQQLLDRLRRIGRMQEGHFQAPYRQGATGDLGTYYFPTFNDDGLGGIGSSGQTYYGAGNIGASQNLFQPFVPMPEGPMPSGVNANQSFASVPLSESEDQCARCGMFYEDEFSSSTESDEGESDTEAPHLYGHYDQDPSLLGNVLHGEYMLAKQRWRRFSGRPPRRYRRGHFNKYHQKNNYQKLQKYGKTYASFLPPNAFAAHRGPGGKSTGKGVKGRQNPRGRDGNPLKCHRCGSTEHLIRKCPMPDNKSQGNQPNALAMLTGNANSLQFYTRTTPVTAVNVQSLGSPSVVSAEGSSSSSAKRASSVADDLESLRSIASSRRKKDAPVADNVPSSQPSADYSLNPEPRCPPPSEPAPTLSEIQIKVPQVSVPAWTTFTTGSAASTATTDELMKGLLETTRKPKRQHALQDGEGKQSSPSRRDQAKKSREATTLQLTQLLRTVDGPPAAESNASEDQPTFPWWETAVDVPSGTFHSARTTTRDGRIGLLVDPGAHDNLSGEMTMRQLESQLSTRARIKALDSPLSVSGVGKESQSADVALSIDFELHHGSPEQTKCSYTAPVIPGSRLPPLLGLKSLVSKRAVIDTFGKLLVLPGAGGIEFRCSPGTQILPLEMSESGHLLLPMMPPTDRSAASSTMSPDRVDFTVQCRRARTPSPKRTPAPSSRHGPYSRSGDVVLTGVLSRDEPPEPTNPPRDPAPWRGMPMRTETTRSLPPRSKATPDAVSGISATVTTESVAVPKASDAASRAHGSR